MDLTDIKCSMVQCRTYHNISKIDLYEKVQIVRELLGLTFEDYPLNIAKLERRLSVFVIIERTPLATPKLCGFLIKKDFPKKSIIIINSKLSPQDYFFALAHETIHYFCHNETSESMNNPLLFKEHSENEKQANEGAAELLLPYKLFIPDYKICIDEYKNNVDAISNTAKAYCINPEVVKFRVLNLENFML